MPVFESPHLKDNWQEGLKQSINNSQPILGMHYVANLIDEMEKKISEMKLELADLAEALAGKLRATEKPTPAAKKTADTTTSESAESA